MNGCALRATPSASIHSLSATVADSKRWCERRCKNILSVTYHHLVFALPSSLNHWVSLYPDLIYHQLYQSAWKTLKTIGADPKRLNGQIGLTVRFRMRERAAYAVRGQNDKQLGMMYDQKRITVNMEASMQTLRYYLACLKYSNAR